MQTDLRLCQSGFVFIYLFLVSSDLLQFQEENKKMALKIRQLNKEKQTSDEKFQQMVYFFKITFDINLSIK